MTPGGEGQGRLTPQAFAERWGRAKLTERAAAQSHFSDLCRMLGQKTPTEADPEGDFYAFRLRLAGGSWRTAGGGDAPEAARAQQRTCELVKGFCSRDVRSLGSFEERETGRRTDAIIAQLTQTDTQLSARVPELDAPDRGPGEAESAGEGPGRGEAPEEPQRVTERPWWRQVFGG